MTGLQEMIFLSEIVLQSKIAQRAAERLKVSEDNFDNIEIWASIQSILVAAANVSKILWPNKKYEKRGEHLRKLLKVADDSPLADRKFRNHFEHYDDRIEEWFKSHRSGVYIDLAMNPSLPGRMFNNNHRGYNSFNGTLVFRDESLDLNEVVKSLETLLENSKPFVL